MAAFGEEEGTLWVESGSRPLPLSEIQKPSKSWLRALRRRLQKRPLVWFVDDECANRDWFVESHRLHFALLTFSSRKHVVAALQAGTLCDAVVTDIFFPAKPRQTMSRPIGFCEFMRRSSHPQFQICLLSGPPVKTNVRWTDSTLHVRSSITRLAARSTFRFSCFHGRRRCCWEVTTGLSTLPRQSKILTGCLRS